ncbi:MAG: hypothetical protein ACREBO_12080 [Novosphingobium sp.]
MSRPWPPAAKRYTLRLLVLMSLYLALLFVAVWLFRHNSPTGPAAWALAIAPALPVIGVFWAVMRYIAEETDEFFRMLLVRQCLVATGFCLTVVTIWEFLQTFDLVGKGNGGFGAAFFWFMGLGIGAFYNRVTIGTAGGCA